MEIQAKEDYILQYIDYDSTLQDRDEVEMTFYTKQRDNELNKKGGPRAKGGQVPQPAPAAAPMPTPVAVAPQ